MVLPRLKVGISRRKDSPRREQGVKGEKKGKKGEKGKKGVQSTGILGSSSQRLLCEQGRIGARFGITSMAEESFFSPLRI